MSTFTTVNANGVLLGASGQQRVSLSSAQDNVLQLSGTASNVLSKLRGLDQPSDDTDATSRTYVQNYVQTALRGLQMKMAVRLASMSNVNLSGGGLENSSTVLRWASASVNQSLLSTPDSYARSIIPGSYFASSTSSWTFAYVFRGNNEAGFFDSEFGIRFNEGGSRAAGPNFFPRSGTAGQGIMHPNLSSQIEACSGGWAQLPGNPGRMIFAPSAFAYTDDIYFHFTFDGTERKCTMSIAKMVNGSLQLVPTAGGWNLYRNTNPGYSTYDEGLFIANVGDALYALQAYSGGPATFTNITLANKIMTLQEVFGPAPAGWTTTGIDGVVPSANDRVLLAGQTNAVQNGIWQVSSDGTSLQRPADFAAGSNAQSAYVFVNGSGQTNDNKGFLETSNGASLVDADAQTWQVYTAAGGLGGLSVNGSTISASSNITFANNIVAPELITGTTTLLPAQIADSTGTLTFSGTNIVAPSVNTGTLTASAGSLTDSSGSISMGSTSVTTTGSVQATAFTSPSDARLKRDSVPLSASWQDANGTNRSLYDLAPVSFVWRNNEQLDFGVIAQDVESLLASYQLDRGSGVQPVPLVSTGSDGSADIIKTVDYGKLSVLCLAMCRDLHAQITGAAPGTNLAALVGTPYQNKPDDVPDDLWGVVRFLYLKLGDLEGYIRALASQIAPPAQPLDVGAGFGAFPGEANLPHLAGTDPALNGDSLPGVSEWV